MNLIQIRKQIDYLKAKGINPRIILMSEPYHTQFKNEFPDMFSTGEGIHKSIFLIDGMYLGIYTDPMDDYFVKVVGD